MPEPNPLLGLHVTPGAVTWTRVRREPDGSFRVLDWAVERASEDAAAAVARAAEVAARRPFRGRGAFVALPDGSGCLATAAMQPDELDLAGEDLQRELHEYTPFEPDVASLRYRLARTDGRKREFLVAAIPAAQERRFLDAAAGCDDGSVGFGFAGASVVRGAGALGLTGPSGFLVELLPRTTHVYAVDDGRVRRYLVAAGADDVVTAAATALSRDPGDVRRQIETGTADETTQGALAAAAAAIAEDVRAIAAYHVAQQFAPKDVPEDHPPSRFVGVGRLTARAPLRRALAAHLGEAFGRTPQAPAGASLAWDRPPGDDLTALVGPLGAALEAFAPAEARLALRDPPSEVEEAPERRPWAWALGVAVLAAGAWSVWTVSRQEEPAPIPHVAEPAAAPERTTDPPRADPPPAPAELQFTAEALPGGAVRLEWSDGPPETAWRVQRLDPGATAWTDVADATRAPAEMMDDPPGPSGTYRWRLVAESGDATASGERPVAGEVSLARAVDVAAEFLGIDGSGRARFLLRRTWRGREVTAETAAPLGAHLEAKKEAEGAPGGVVLLPGLAVRAVRIRDAEERVRLPVAEFGPDGRVLRAADGSVPLVEREVLRRVRIHEVDLARTPDGPTTTVSRKMTDG